MLFKLFEIISQRYKINYETISITLLTEFINVRSSKKHHELHVNIKPN